MEIQIMGSQGNGGDGDDSEDGKQTHAEFLAKQSSPFRLPLDEVQKNNFGEPLQSINLDNLLKNVFPQEMSRSAMEDPDISRFLSKKTADGGWRENQEEEDGGGAEPERRARLGEMTLEDFLMKAGIEADGSGARAAQHWMSSYLPSRPTIDISSPLLAGRKRVAGKEMAERAVEKRQKRMIKNRESAARSRARKQNEQAYTNELESILLRLEEENLKLRKEKELDTFLHSIPLPEPKQQLRRSTSALF